MDEKAYAINPQQVAENYIGHNLFLLPEAFNEIFDPPVEMNALYIQLADGADLEGFIHDYGADNRIAAVIDMTTAQASVLDSFGSLDVITLVLVISAAGLAFVVLYNLLNINISERLRELSTIKVLGFYDYEVSLYIYYEIILITFAGAVLGLGAGYWLTDFILRAMSLKDILLGIFIAPSSYFWSVIITLLFATVLMLYMHQRLRHIDMVEALKAVE